MEDLNQPHLSCFNGISKYLTDSSVSDTKGSDSKALMYCSFVPSMSPRMLSIDNPQDGMQCHRDAMVDFHNHNRGFPLRKLLEPRKLPSMNDQFVTPFRHRISGSEWPSANRMGDNNGAKTWQSAEDNLGKTRISPYDLNLNNLAQPKDNVSLAYMRRHRRQGRSKTDKHTFSSQEMHSDKASISQDGTLSPSSTSPFYSRDTVPTKKTHNSGYISGQIIKTRDATKESQQQVTQDNKPRKKKKVPTATLR